MEFGLLFVSNNSYNLICFLLFKYSLEKTPDKRGSCEELLKEPFIVKYVDQPNDLKLIERVITEIKNDVLEP